MVCYIVRAAQDIVAIIIGYDGGFDKHPASSLLYAAAPTEVIPVSYILYVHFKAY